MEYTVWIKDSNGADAYLVGGISKFHAECLVRSLLLEFPKCQAWMEEW